ncbi:MAG: PQQ-binding-like beta-propeller repeat protein [Planctomycetota bacterium]
MTDSSSEIKTQATNSSLVSRYRNLRIWPAIVLLIGMVFFRYAHQLVEDGPAWIWMSSAFGPALCGLLILAWWVLLSRATITERIGGTLALIGLAALAIGFSHPTMIGPAIPVIVIPLATMAFAIGAILTSHWKSFQRTWVAIALATIALCYTALLRNDGMWGDFSAQFSWRFVPSIEEQLVESNVNFQGIKLEESELASELDSMLENAEWPGFRGPLRDGVQRGTSISLDWEQNPPEQEWRISVGPGWGAFIVAGDLLFTQEQRGKMESVVCYSATDGRQIWIRNLESRFEDPLGGPGPRTTPELRGDDLFVMGASGNLAKLDAKNGNVKWEVDVQQLAGNDEPPMWGYSCSPAVNQSGELVVVYGGKGGENGLLAFDTENGELVWSANAGDFSYGSPQFLDVQGKQTLALLSQSGLQLFEPQTGELVLDYDWQHEGYRALQPYVGGNGAVLIPTGLGTGTRRIDLQGDRDESLSAKEIWTTRALKADFSDLVVFENYVYGFDGGIFTCLDFETGQRQWKGGRYGKGQVLLVEDSGALIVVTETGDLVLLKADPSKHVELARVKALEGKTWNHPVLVGDKLYLRNSQEAVCLKIKLSPNS